MRKLILPLLIVVLCGCKSKTTDSQISPDAYSFFVGTYTGPESEGIYKYSLNKKGHLKFIGLAAKTKNPSFLTLTKDKKFLISVSEISDIDGMGSVESYKIYDDSISLVNRSPSGGASPCYVASNKNSYVLTANYNGGNVGLLKINSNGELSGLLDIQQHTGMGTTDRQKEPHAHSVMVDSESEKIVTADLGTNQIWFSKIDDERHKLIPSYPLKLNMEDGAGPRHMAFHPNGKFLYVINELNNTVSLLKRDIDKNFVMGSSVSTLPADFSEPNYCADIHISSDGKFLYASNRGHNSIAIFKIIPENGKLIPKGHELTLGEAPRNFSLSPDANFLLVANKNSDNIVSFKRDETSGLLEFIDQIDAPNPVCILFND